MSRPEELFTQLAKANNIQERIMKETIYTIPVNDAYDSDCSCPLCFMEARLKEQLVDYYLGPALMEPDVRKTTNAKGFCPSHMADLYNREDNRLGLGLTLHTHLKDLIADVGPKIRRAVPGRKSGLFGRGSRDYRQDLLQAAKMIDERVSSCVICERIDYTMDRYLDVIFFQYFADSRFKAKFESGKGYCLPHFALLLKGAAKFLNQNQAAVFVEKLAELQGICLDTLCDDVEWYTLKFDYRNHDKDWKNSKDAIPRTIRRLAGEIELKGRK